MCPCSPFRSRRPFGSIDPGAPRNSSPARYKARVARLPYLDPGDAEPRVADALAKTPDLGIFRMVANAQRAFPAWLRFGGAMLDPDEFDPLLREFAITRVAAMTPGADYQWVQHARVRLNVGGTQEQLEAIQRGELDAAVLMAGRLMATTQIELDPSVGAAALQ